MPAPRNRDTPARRSPVSVLGVLLGSLVLVASGIGAYVAARETSLFTVERVQVEGATPEVAEQVRAALSPFVGKSLVTFDSRAAHFRLASISEVAGFEVDRAFPHTLRVQVEQERPVGVLRRGAEAWLVAASTRVLRPLDRRAYPKLPRLWLPRAVDVTVNETMSAPQATGIAALAPLGPLGMQTLVRAVRANDAELTLVLAGGRELRLGNPGDLRLKLAIARRILPLTHDAVYVDVSVPERPVAGYNPQVAG